MVWGKRMGFEEGKEEEERKKERQKKYCVIKAYIAGIPRQLFWFSGHSIELFFFFHGDSGGVGESVLSTGPLYSQ